MARTPITPVQYNAAGVATIAAALSDTVNGNEVANSSTLALFLENATAGDVTVTFITTGVLSGYDVEDVTVTMPAASSLVFGRFPAAVFGRTVEFTTSAAINVTAYQ